MAWHAKAEGAYSQGSTECTENAKEVYNYLSAKGWKLNAIAGILGNAYWEGGMNPWRWQNDTVQSTTGSPWYNIGYGLWQFTEAGTYINNAKVKANAYYAPNFSDKTGKATDGIAQCYCIDVDARGGYIPTSKYNLTFAQYKVSTLSAYELATVWLFNYERSGDRNDPKTQKRRGDAANYFYKLLSGETPPTPPTGEYSITIQIEGNGSAFADLGDSVPITSAKSGTSVGLEYHPNGSAQFLGFTVVSGGITISNYHFTMPSNDVIILARFTGKTPEPTPHVKAKSKMIYYIPWWRKYGL